MMLLPNCGCCDKCQDLLLIDFVDVELEVSSEKSSYSGSFSITEWARDKVQGEWQQEYIYTSTQNRSVTWSVQTFPKTTFRLVYDPESSQYFYQFPGTNKSIVAARNIVSKSLVINLINFTDYDFNPGVNNFFSTDFSWRIACFDGNTNTQPWRYVEVIPLKAVNSLSKDTHQFVDWQQTRILSNNMLYYDTNWTETPGAALPVSCDRTYGFNFLHTVRPYVTYRGTSYYPQQDTEGVYFQTRCDVQYNTDFPISRSKSYGTDQPTLSTTQSLVFGYRVKYTLHSVSVGRASGAIDSVVASDNYDTLLDLTSKGDVRGELVSSF